MTTTGKGQRTPDTSSSAKSAANAIDEVRILRAVMQGTSGSTGDAFFTAMVENLASALNTNFASIGLCDPTDPDWIQTYAVWHDGVIAENIRYPLRGSPCDEVIQDRICVYPDDVQTQFPEDSMLADMGARCFVGSPLVSKNGERFGILNVVGDHAMDPKRVVVAEMVLEIFAARAVSEVSRLEVHESLLRHQTELEAIVQERTKTLEEAQKKISSSARLASLGTLASGIAHEINNPLGSILLAGESLRHEPNSSRTRVTALDHIPEAVAQCKAIVSSIQRFARSEVSKKSPLNVNESIEWAIESFAIE
jgi:two-component system, NtrC family, sensor kinase